MTQRFAGCGRIQNTLEFIAHIQDAFPRVKNPDAARLGQAAQSAEAAGFDTVLIGYGSTRAESWVVAANVLFHTKTLKALVAQRPGMIPPPLLARTASTLDMLSGGRVALNLVAGGSALEQARECDFVEHDARYERAAECMELAVRCWTETEEFAHEGKFFKAEGIVQEVKPATSGYPGLYVGGASPAGKDFAVRFADVYMLWGEPLADTRKRIDDMRQLAAKASRRPMHFSVSLRLIIGDTEAEAWEKANALVKNQNTLRLPGPADEKEDVGRSRQIAFAKSGLVHDQRLWLGITAATGGLGATSALVGTADQVADAIVEYIKLGVTRFQLSSARGGLLDAPPDFLPMLRKRGEAALAASR